MSYQTGSICYSTATAANAAAVAGLHGSVVSTGAGPVVITAGSASEGKITLQYQSLTGGPVSVVTLDANPVECQQLTVTDGLAIGWGIAAAWILTAAVMFMRRGVHL